MCGGGGGAVSCGISNAIRSHSRGDSGGTDDRIQHSRHAWTAHSQVPCHGDTTTCPRPRMCVCDTSPHHVVEVVVVRRGGGINERAVAAANYCGTAARRPTTGNGRISRSKFDKSFPSPSFALCNAPFNAPCSPVTPLLLVIAWYCTVLPLRSEQPPQSPHTRRNKLLLSTRRRSVRGRGCDFEVQ